MYKLSTNGVIRLSDNVFISSINTNNPDWITYQEWLALGNIPIDEGPTLEQCIANKIAEINAACEGAIVAGFSSAALGHTHTYDSGIEDQINLIGAVIAAGAGVSVEYKCYDENGDKEWYIHTPQQMQQVYMDGLVYKVTQLKKATYLKGLVSTATDISTLEGINW